MRTVLSSRMPSMKMSFGFGPAMVTSGLILLAGGSPSDGAGTQDSRRLGPPSSASRASKQLATTRRELADAKAELGRKQQEIAALKARIETVEAEKADLHRRGRALGEEFVRLQNAHAALRWDLAAVTGRLPPLQIAVAWGIPGGRATSWRAFQMGIAAATFTPTFCRTSAGLASPETPRRTGTAMA
jgi:hypothetical protein